MAEQTKIRADLSQLESLLKQIGGEYVARVGILDEAGTPVEGGNGLTMGALGLIHEFGSESNNIPPRSFLRMPLETKQDQLIEKLDTGEVKKSIESGNIKQLYKVLGREGEQIVKETFLTKGFGNWKDNAPITIEGGWMTSKSGKPFYVKGKGQNDPLYATGALSRSIASDVIKRSEL